MTSAILSSRLLPGLWHMLLNVAFPPHCPSCRVEVHAEGNFCPRCFEQLRMIHTPLCTCCGIPFPFDVGEAMECPQCLDKPPAFAAARAPLVYDTISAPLVSALKFHDQWGGLSRHAALMRHAGAELLSEADAMIPVPLHWRRLLWRRFNQSALLAYALHATTDLPCHPEWLVRRRYTTPQRQLHRSHRLRNLRNAFMVPDTYREAVRGKTLLLIDDVVTTGATVNACARALKKAGAAKVLVLALARTVRE